MTVSTIPQSSILGNVTTGQPIVNQVSTNYLWAQAVLLAAGLPTTQSNLNFMTVWMQNEEPTGNWFHNNNPLNINAGGSGSDTFPSLTASALETAKYLKMPYYKGIYAALATGNASQATLGQAVIASPWASGHYGGSVSKFTGTPPPIIAAGTGATLGSGGVGDGSSAGVGSGAPGTCGARGGGIDILGAHIGDACQIKALTGALLIGLGGGILLVGATLIAAYGLSQTKVGKVGLAATSGTPVGRVANIAAGAPSRARRAPRRAAAPVRAPATPAPATPELSEEEADHHEREAGSPSREGQRARYNRWRTEGFAPSPGDA